jgi:pyruvate/2-oxoglutarate dehydrogenase complex dihydrolipoamide dehydrogenase (E3) component
MNTMESENPHLLSQPPEPEDYDLVLLGSGTGSKILAWTFAREGQRVVTVERKYLGGSCPNIACMPSKNIIHSAKVASYVRQSRDFGLSVDSFSVNMCAVRDRKRRMVSDLVDLHRDKYQKSGGELILGTGRFVAPRTIEVDLPEGTVRRLRGKNVVISTGSRARVDDIPGLAKAQPLTHIEALELDRVPQHLLVLGGGYVGLELAQAMRRFGSKVTIIESHSRVVPHEDDDVTDGLHELLQDEGIDVVVNAEVQRVSGKSGDRVIVVCRPDDMKITVEGTHLLAATGRTPNTDGIGLETIGVELTRDGYVKVNERLETTVPGVWAVGDVNGGPKFTHISYDDFHVVHDNIMGGNHVTTGRQVPFCLFTDPEMARVGLSEKEAQIQGIEYRLFKIPMEEVLRARTLSETRGFMKALVEPDGERILGFTIFGPEAGEVMSAVQLVMLAGMPYTKLRDAVLTHPTMMEGLIPLFESSPTRVTRSVNANA